MENALGAAAAAEAENAFEAERARIMAKNRKALEEIGVLQAANKLHCLKQQALRGKYTGVKRPKAPTVVPDGPSRTSRRIRGQPVEQEQAAVPVAAAENTAEEAASAAAPATPQVKAARFQLTDTHYAAPFTLTSIGTTVWELGEIYRGPWQDKYWSSRGCLFRHAYPVGFVATKQAFNKTWRMTITAGDLGPIFTVCDESGALSFSGTSPTKPWTDVCLAHRTGQRISGPQYFGFSDVHLQRAIAAQYTPQELSCALYGTPLTGPVWLPAQAAAEPSAEPASEIAVAEAPSTPKAKDPQFQLTDTQYAAPFTLTSIGTTIWEVGEIYRGPWQDKFWSSRGCLFRHAYPVGFVATKQAFNKTWRMTITAGDTGPVFSVCDESGALSFSGTSPTKPWTDVCLAQRTKQRISGPQYFGFSDVHLQHAIAALYTPQELSWALYGTPLTGSVRLLVQAAAEPAAAISTTNTAGTDRIAQQQQQLNVPQQEHSTHRHLSLAELFARELQESIRGIGAATSAVLATTTALGGKQHTSIEGLRLWLAADACHVERLKVFLTSSEELPPACLHLPSWSSKWVPMILQQLQS